MCSSNDQRLRRFVRKTVFLTRQVELQPLIWKLWDIWDDPAYPELRRECEALADVHAEEMKRDLPELLAKYDWALSQEKRVSDFLCVSRLHRLFSADHEALFEL
jgi:hypothetical protein